jgi:hypothetical protein
VPCVLRVWFDQLSAYCGMQLPVWVRGRGLQRAGAGGVPLPSEAGGAHAVPRLAGADPSRLRVPPSVQAIRAGGPPSRLVSMV